MTSYHLRPTELFTSSDARFQFNLRNQYKEVDIHNPSSIPGHLLLPSLETKFDQGHSKTGENPEESHQIHPQWLLKLVQIKAVRIKATTSNVLVWNTGLNVSSKVTKGTLGQLQHKISHQLCYWSHPLQLQQQTRQALQRKQTLLLQSYHKVGTWCPPRISVHHYFWEHFKQNFNSDNSWTFAVVLKIYLWIIYM